ncbi:MAG: hypothetical protein KW804_02415 [Candidatus Doudnabacteria bacterium]|nr:hypothetical protein [Candidatus Doudnabacteria bacterium]
MSLQVDNLEIKDIYSLGLESVKQEEFISRLEELAQDEQYNIEPMASREFYNAIEALLVKYGGQINGTDIYRRLYYLETRLFWRWIRN